MGAGRRLKDFNNNIRIVGVEPFLGHRIQGLKNMQESIVPKIYNSSAIDEKINVNGGAIAMGHPIGATGAMIVGALLDELERRDLKRGLVTMCAAGGMAPAIIIERI